MMIDAKAVLLLIILHIVFFGWLGTVLFEGSAEREVYFNNISNACWHMLILLTTANFPDVMMPAYS